MAAGSRGTCLTHQKKILRGADYACLHLSSFPFTCRMELEGTTMQTYHGCRGRLPNPGLKLQRQAELMAEAQCGEIKKEEVKYLLAPVVFVQSDSGANTCTP